VLAPSACDAYPALSVLLLFSYFAPSECEATPDAIVSKPSANE